ncbi:MAG: proprotein convertase P-domain-containing protein [Acidobacteria bacterium]|nr:proprotein convertase P-domain-containing protein [Acidobacteriota bacterium]
MSFKRTFSGFLFILLALLLTAPGVAQKQGEKLAFGDDDSLEVIREKIRHNGYKFTVDHNRIFDMSPAEKKAFFSRRPSVIPVGPVDNYGPLLSLVGKVALPAAFDWRNVGGHSYIGPVRDQGSCGSCYSFGANACAEGTYNYANGLVDGNCIDFSESFIIWCLGSIEPYSSHFSGCNGADYEYMELQALVDIGVCDEAHFPYVTSNPGCTHWGDPMYKFNGWYRVPCNDITAIKTAIYTYGVVDAAVYVDSAFSAYSGGIYENTSTECTGSPTCAYVTTNHAISLVGWDDAEGVWILRNSWGSTSWGEGGYMRIKYTSARVACSVCYMTYTPAPNVVRDSDGLTAESCSPANQALDPGETVAMDITLKNTGSLDTTNLTATLLAGDGVTSPGPAQNYGALTAGGAGVTRNFSFTVDPSYACGAPVTLTLQLNDNGTDLGTLTIAKTLGTVTGGGLTFSSGAVSAPIPDNNTTGVSVPVAVSASGLVGGVKAKVRIDHTYDGDVTLSLISPLGTTVALSNKRGSSGDNFGSGAQDCTGTYCVFDDAAATAIGSGTAPFAGSYKPDGTLSTFKGEAMNGTWYLKAVDSASSDSGTVYCVELEFSRSVCCGQVGTPDMIAGSKALTAENCSPANQGIDPGETVTVELGLLNVGDGATTNLVATLQPGGGVTNPGPAQTYGAMAAGGAEVKRSFSFTADSSLTCGGTFTATLQLQDGALDLGTADFAFKVGATQAVSFGPFNGGAVTIPASGAGTPYPSTVTVAGVTGTVSKVTVTLSGLTHTFPGDIDILLVGPNGQTVMLLSDTGSGTDVTGVNLTFDDAAASSVGSTIVSGTFKPTNSGTADAMPSPAPAEPYGTTLSVFNGVGANGDWKLFVQDDATPDSGSLTGWSLNITSADPVCCTGAPPPAADPYDFNGDGYTDILWRNGTTGALGDWYVTPAGAAAGALTGTVSDGNWQVFGSGDFNSSGIADLIWRNVSTGDLAIWLMGAGGYDSTVSLGYVDPGWKVLGAADLNANGNADILWRNFNDGYLSVWLMSNTVGVLGSTFAGGISSMEWKAVGSGHFDNDGRADVLWWNATTGVLSIWFEDENGWQGDMSPGTVDTTWKITGIGDVDGNGIDDLLWRNATSGDLSVWFLNNGGTVSGTTFLGGIADLNWKVKGVGFFNNDAYADILWRHATSGDTVVWYLSGTGKIGELFLGTVDPVWVTLNQGNFPGHTELP